MFRRKSVSKGAKERGSARAKKAVKRLLERPTPERIAAIAELASRENLQPFRVRGVLDRRDFWGEGGREGERGVRRQ